MTHSRGAVAAHPVKPAGTGGPAPVGMSGGRCCTWLCCMWLCCQRVSGSVVGCCPGLRQLAASAWGCWEHPGKTAGILMWAPLLCAGSKGRRSAYSAGGEATSLGGGTCCIGAAWCACSASGVPSWRGGSCASAVPASARLASCCRYGSVLLCSMRQSKMLGAGRKAASKRQAGKSLQASPWHERNCGSVAVSPASISNRKVLAASTLCSWREAGKLPQVIFWSPPPDVGRQDTEG